MMKQIAELLRKIDFDRITDGAKEAIVSTGLTKRTQSHIV